MRIRTEGYELSQKAQPHIGQYIIGHQNEEEIVVYQAYKPSIAKFAVTNQFMGGNEYSYNRMSWIKPNFLWMMYRCGWAEKENQERVLALWINKKVLEDILSNAVLSSFDARYYPDQDTWKNELDAKEVRLQWDPDHDPHGNRTVRRALQLGLKGELLANFCKCQFNLIEDITDFVKEQSEHVKNNRLDNLVVPIERVWEPGDPVLKKKFGIDD